MKVNREMKEAIEKHGEVQPPKKYEDVFWERINKKKEELARR